MARQRACNRKTTINFIKTDFMKNLNFWRSLFFSALAVAAFGACSDDDEKGDFDAVIKVDDKKETTVGIAAAGGETQAVTVTSAGPWTLAFESDQEWCFPNVTSGKGGSTELVFSVDPLPDGVEERSATAVLSAPGSIFEVEYVVKAKVTVRQSASGSTIPTTNVAKVRELLVAMNPTDTKTAVTEELAAMTITGVVVSEASGVNWGNAYNIAVQDDGQAKHSGLTLNATKFANLALSAGQVVAIPLTGATVSTYYGALQLNIANDTEISVVGTTPDAPAPIVITPDALSDYESMLVQIDNCYPTAGTGAAWNTSSNKGNTVFTTTAGLTFTVRVGNSAAFKGDLIPAKSGSMIGLAGINAGTSGTVYQVSPRTAADIKLTEEMPAPEYKKATIAELKNNNNYEVEATIVAVYQKGLMLADATGYTLVFNNAWQQPTTDPYNPYIGDVGKKVTVKGTVTEFNGLMQFTAPEITLGAVSDYVLPTPPLTFDAAALTAYESDKKYEYVSLTGTLTITKGSSYNTYTVIVPGYTSKTVTLAYGLDSYYTDKGLATGDVVDITGFAIGFDTSKINIMVREINKNNSVPSLMFTSEPKPFAGSSPVAQTLDFEARNISALALEMFTFKGDNADKFNVDNQSGNSVTISAKGNNDSGALYTATLVVTVDGQVLAEVDVKQSPIPTGNDTKGTFTSMPGMLPSATNSTDCYYAEKAKINGSTDEVDILKLGTGKKAGAFTTAAVGVTGNKKLSFYAAAWNGKTATLYVRINNGGSVTPASVSLAGNTGVSNSSPYTITFNDDTEYFTVTLTDLTAASTITFSTDSGFTAGASNTTSGRALIAGIQIY